MAKILSDIYAFGISLQFVASQDANWHDYRSMAVISFLCAMTTFQFKPSDRRDAFGSRCAALVFSWRTLHICKLCVWHSIR